MSRLAVSTHRLLLLLLALGAFFAVPLAGDTRPSPLEAESLSRKLQAIAQHATAPAGGRRSTPVTESEINSFLSLTVRNQLPTGVSDPRLTMVGDGQVAATATVDLDAVRRSSKPEGMLDPRQWLTGRVPVEVRGLLRAVNGYARFDLQTAEVSGIPVPKFLLQEIVTYYSRSDEFPSGIDLDAPFQLPARIREIHVIPQQAIVVQH
jgi:hypothetical protein